MLKPFEKVQKKTKAWFRQIFDKKYGPYKGKYFYIPWHKD